MSELFPLFSHSAVYAQPASTALSSSEIPAASKDDGTNQAHKTENSEYYFLCSIRTAIIPDAYILGLI